MPKKKQSPSKDRNAADSPAPVLRRSSRLSSAKAIGVISSIKGVRKASEGSQPPIRKKKRAGEVHEEVNEILDENAVPMNDEEIESDVEVFFKTSMVYRRL